MPRSPRPSRPAKGRRAGEGARGGEGFRRSPTLGFTPRGHLRLLEEEGAAAIDPRLAERLVAAFAEGAGAGVLHLGAVETATALPPALAYARELGALFVATLRGVPDVDARLAAGTLPDASEADLARLVLAVPPMTGAEYVTKAALAALWDETAAALLGAVARSGETVEAFLRARNPAWHHVGRVHFHLAENLRDPQRPFAFLATYTPRLSAAGKTQHVPLGRALDEYGGARDRDRLLSLLQPVQRAAETCDWLKELADEGALFHPLRWTPAEAFRMLQDVAALEAAGVVVRMPAGWKGGRPPRARVHATVGDTRPSVLGVGALLDFDVGLSLDGETLTPAEIEQILASSAGLTMLRGRWVEVDPERLEALLQRYRRLQTEAERTGLDFAEAARLLAESAGDEDADADAASWAGVAPGAWLRGVLHCLRNPQALDPLRPGRGFRARLRPYQEVGVRWLRLLSTLGLGACLADDMGLGKTLQVLALLHIEKRRGEGPSPNLLVAPASLLHNWAAEAERFVPSLKLFVAHPSAMPSKELKALDPARLEGVDLVVTSYASLLRLPWIADVSWRHVVLDEAQAIKNPGTRQAKASKALSARSRIALTGTPVENRLGDLWSIFDFLNPGLLGSARAFTRWVKELEKRPSRSYAPLRALVQPYILRRLKTDRSILPDLPEKSEVTAYCTLTRKQAALYEDAVEDLAASLKDRDEMERRGLVLATLMRFKQICNHPSQWLGDGGWEEKDSGKWARLREIAETLASRQEKMLIFTQYREMTGPLAAFLGSVWGREGLVLHGGTPVGKRKDLVRRFQEEEETPFFVLSLKAGGTGLNLTAASHVVHFDRWWNPAVEDQATDRAFRIGQGRNVLVHKFVCRGTVEERIDEMIHAKRGLATELLRGGAEKALTEMDDEELLRLVRLDMGAARGEN